MDSLSTNFDKILFHFIYRPAYTIEQTSSKHRAGSSRPIGTPLPGSNVGLNLHVGS